ncbi:MAG: hypothetical protein A2X86_03080 [Bdellovibrionales bacterium GWA2_49_15]|nr:MAG: hypothetical protein A2X86_03080 [Bdellovibrionales bacterium GWA2_49_15]HAZ12197.1 hypothetical protein [Bdellovibrionales bacterium]
MKKIAVILWNFLAFSLAENSALANTSTASLDHGNGNGNAKKLTLEFVLASEQTKDNNTSEVNGTYNKLDVSALYSLAPDDELRLFSSALYIAQDDPAAEDQLRGDLVELMYRRKNLLNESDHGVRLEAELKYYQLIDSETKTLYGFDGAFIPQLIFTKYLTDSFLTEFKARHHFNNVTNDRASTLKRETRLYLTPTYVLTRSLFLSTTLKYQHKTRNGDYYSYRTSSFSPKSTDHVTAHPGLMYLINRQFLIEGYAETEFLTSNDHQTFKENWEKNYVLGTALYWTAF